MRVGQRRVAVTVGATIFAIVLIIVIAVAGIHVVSQLDSMASNLVRVSEAWIR